LGILSKSLRINECIGSHPHPDLGVAEANECNLGKKRKHLADNRFPLKSPSTISTKNNEINPGIKNYKGDLVDRSALPRGYLWATTFF
jgi:hypothetical protein